MSDQAIGCELEALRARVAQLEKLDSEAAQVEMLIIARCGFTGEPPYVGWEGLGLALREKLDLADALVNAMLALPDWSHRDYRTSLALIKEAAASYRSRKP